MRATEIERWMLAVAEFDPFEPWLAWDSALESGGARITFGRWKPRLGRCCRRRER
jgi:hypothetical protein